MGFTQPLWNKGLPSEKRNKPEALLSRLAVGHQWHPYGPALLTSACRRHDDKDRKDERDRDSGDHHDTHGTRNSRDNWHLNKCSDKKTSSRGYNRLRAVCRRGNNTVDTDKGCGSRGPGNTPHNRRRPAQLLQPANDVSWFTFPTPDQRAAIAIYHRCPSKVTGLFSPEIRER